MDTSNLNYAGEDFGDAWISAPAKKLTPEQTIKALKAALADWLRKHRDMSEQEIATIVSDVYQEAVA